MKEKTKGILRIVGTGFEILIVIVMLFISILTITTSSNSSNKGAPSMFGYSVMAVETDSMKPVFAPGDLIISKQLTSSQMKNLRGLEKDVNGEVIYEGDIISFWTIIDGSKEINTHRIVEVIVNTDANGNDNYLFITKGDNEAQNDSYVVPQTEVIAKYESKIGGVGNIVLFIQDGNNYVFCVILPLAALFLLNVYFVVKMIMESKLEKQKKALANEAKAALSEEEKQLLLEELKKQVRQELEQEQAPVKDEKKEADDKDVK